MVAPWKIEEVKNLSEMVREHKVVGIIDLFGLPAAQLHQIRKNFRGRVTIKVSKKRLLERALKENNLNGLVEHLQGIPALILTNEDPIKIFKEISEFKTPAPAKPGVTSPKDIIIPSGPTDLPPMAISTLKRFGLKCKVEGGKVTILEEKKVLNAGEEITPELADLLNKLGIMPLEISLNIVCLSDKKYVYDKETLELTLKDFSEDVKNAFIRAFYLALGRNILNKYTVRPIVQKAYRNAIALASGVLLPVKESIIEHVKKAHRIASLLKERVNVY